MELRANSATVHRGRLAETVLVPISKNEQQYNE